MKKMSNKNELKREESSKQHGVGGVYYGGDWVDIEDCADTFLVEESKCSGCQNSKQIRSASSNYQPQKVDKVRVFEKNSKKKKRETLCSWVRTIFF